MTTTSIVDIPKKHGETDLFGIDRYSKGLIKFIRQSDTPITIAIQGEWGSGKTSLMNTLQNELCGANYSTEQIKDHRNEFYSIWINTWQYSLMNSQEETLVSIVTSVSTQIMNIISTRHIGAGKKFTNGLVNFIGRGTKSLLKIGADKIIEGGGDVIDALVDREKANQTIKGLRDDLQGAIVECLEKDKAIGLPKKGFIVFVDDLDRIDPPVAVQILELLKNIFDLENCVFVLAIDYDVVIKGLKPKFGELTEKNEREFRSFFDKIIQMPFSMPVASYNIDQFLINSLIKIGYLQESKLGDNVFAHNITTICNLSVGNNPRSLKRLLNTVSLINIISKETADTDETQINDDYVLLINFALICVQIAYPALYKILCSESDFKKWDQNMVNSLKLRALTENELVKLNESEEFDEEWEKVLFRICERDNYLTNRVLQISQLFNLIAKMLPDGEELGNTLSDLLALSSVTDVQAFDKPKQAINKGPVLKSLSASLMPLLKNKLRPTFPLVRQQSKKVVSNVYISFSNKDWKDCLGISVGQIKDNLAIEIWYHPWAFKFVTSSMQDDIKNAYLTNELSILISEYNNFIQKYPLANFKYNPMEKSYYAKGWHVPQLTITYLINNLDDISSPDFLNTFSDLIIDFMDCNTKLNQLIKDYAEKIK
jgi:DNA polymerase III delta prime subunit